MNKEKEMFFDYAKGGIDYCNPSDKDMLLEVANNIHKLVLFEKPDMVLPIGDKVMMIEHLQFDASKFKKGKGDFDKKLRSQRNEDFDTSISKTDFSEGPLVVTEEAGCNYKAKYYMNNLERVFNEHLLKIESYKNRLIEHNFVEDEQSIVTAFLIIDTTPLGNYRMVDRVPETFTIFQLNKFNEMLGNAKSLDYVFNGFYGDGKKNVSFMSNTPESRAFFKGDYVDFEWDEYFNFEPMETRYCAIINDPNIKKES